MSSTNSSEFVPLAEVFLTKYQLRTDRLREMVERLPDVRVSGGDYAQSHVVDPLSDLRARILEAADAGAEAAIDAVSDVVFDDELRGVSVVSDDACRTPCENIGESTGRGTCEGLESGDPVACVAPKHVASGKGLALADSARECESACVLGALPTGSAHWSWKGLGLAALQNVALGAATYVVFQPVMDKLFPAKEGDAKAEFWSKENLGKFLVGVIAQMGVSWVVRNLSKGLVQQLGRVAYPKQLVCRPYGARDSNDWIACRDIAQVVQLLLDHASAEMRLFREEIALDDIRDATVQFRLASMVTANKSVMELFLAIQSRLRDPRTARATPDTYQAYTRVLGDRVYQFSRLATFMRPSGLTMEAMLRRVAEFDEEGAKLLEMVESGSLTKNDQIARELSHTQSIANVAMSNVAMLDVQRASMSWQFQLIFLALNMLSLDLYQIVNWAVSGQWDKFEKLGQFIVEDLKFFVGEASWDLFVRSLLLLARKGSANVAFVIVDAIGGFTQALFGFDAMEYLSPDAWYESREKWAKRNGMPKWMQQTAGLVGSFVATAMRQLVIMGVTTLVYTTADARLKTDFIGREDLHFPSEVGKHYFDGASIKLDVDKDKIKEVANQFDAFKDTLKDVPNDKFDQKEFAKLNFLEDLVEYAMKHRNSNDAKMALYELAALNPDTVTKLANVKLGNWIRRDEPNKEETKIPESSTAEPGTWEADKFWRLTAEHALKNILTKFDFIEDVTGKLRTEKEVLETMYKDFRDDVRVFEDHVLKNTVPSDPAKLDQFTAFIKSNFIERQTT